MAKILNIQSKSKGSVKEDPTFIQDLREIHKSKRRREEKKPTIVVEFSWKLVLLLILGILVVFLRTEVLTVLIFLFGGFVFMSAAKPVVHFFMRRKFSKGLAVAITYILGILILSAIIAVVVIPFVGQIEGLIKAVPGWINSVTSDFGGITILGYSLDSTAVSKFFEDWIERVTLFENFENIAKTVGSIFSSTALLLASVIFSIYLVLEHDNILEIGLIRITSDVRRNRIKQLMLDVEHKLGRWLLGQAFVSSIAGITMGVLLVIFDIPFALPLAVFVALMSAIPTLGATISAIPPLFVAVVIHGPITAGIILVIFMIYQQIENNVIIPKVMGNVVGLRPIFIMFAAASFFILFGVWGAVLAVPAIVILRICYEFYIDLQKLKARGSI
ncbi:MAG: AI-2E family transporter [Candidatus Dojkabacteria bacterium]